MKTFSSTHFDVVFKAATQYIYLNPLPSSGHHCTLIFLHGLGDSSEGFFDLFSEWDLHQLTPKSCKVILPTAPSKPVSLNNGHVMNSWFDIYSMNLPSNPTLDQMRKEFNQNELNESANRLLKMVKEETQLLPDKDASKIFIGGFSQGCMVSLAAFLKYSGPKHLGGVLGLSGMQALDTDKYVKYSSDLDKYNAIRLQQETPMFLYHGEEDDLLPVENTSKTYEYLQDLYGED